MIHAFDIRGGRLAYRNRWVRTHRWRLEREAGRALYSTSDPRAHDPALAGAPDEGAAGELTGSARIVGPYPALVHDFAITRTRLVLIVCPLTISLERLRRGAPPLAWEPARGAFVGTAPRADPTAVRWFPAPACMVWHVLNAFDDAGRVQLDLCSQAAAAFPTPDGAAPPQAALRQHLARWTIDPAAGEVSARRLSDIACEYPRIDERRTGLPYRYGFLAAQGGPGTSDLHHRALARYDHLTGRMELWPAPDGQAVSEPVFAPRRGAAQEGDGYLLVTIYDEGRDASHLAIFDAQALPHGPIAIGRLAHRVPAGFHGSFVPRA